VEISTALLLTGIPCEANESFLNVLDVATNHQTTSSR
jgi:hypothetical protein